VSETQEGAPRDVVRGVAIGSDHGAVAQKDMLARYVRTLGYRVVDVGCHGEMKVDYPDIAVAVCRKVVSGDCERGIVLDGAGIGSCMAANKVKGIRAAMCYDVRTALNSREHNNANVLTLGGPLHGADQLMEIARAWLATRFGGGRHIPRVNKIMAIERGGSAD
jgi:ribose 5-phosphate isomerase B